MNSNFKIVKDNFYFNKNSRIETQLPFLKGILNIEYFLPIIISKKCNSKSFEEMINNIYQKDKDTAIIIL
jgi:predicted class III extradiol MEMO1 family dioxygenase